MSEMTGVRLTASLAADMLKIPKTDAELALDRLERLELIERLDDGSYRKVHDNLLAISDLPDEGLRLYHRQVLDKATASISEQTPKEKLIGNFSVAFDPEHLDDAKEILKEFFMKIGRLAEKGRNRRKIYNLSTAFFDLTHERKKK
jgi:uncharacterized protein (TIGR02147 family)